MKHKITAQRLREAMEDKKISAQELSNITGIGKSSISQYVNGSHTIGNIKAYQIAKVLDVNPMWLMEFDVPKQRDGLYYIPMDGGSIEDTIRNFEENAQKMYAKYLMSSDKTRKLVDLLLEEGEQ